MEAGAAKGTDRRRLGFLDSFSGLGGTTPVDIKRVRKLLKAGDGGLPLRKRVRKCMKLLGLQGCNKRERT